jgi:hypothetical protein
MAVFVSASDESAGKNRQDQFVFAGLVASDRDWSEIFSPAWQRLVLDGPPSIPYLHMTEMRSRPWREEQGLLLEEAEKRIDEAVAVIQAADFLVPIGVKVSGADMCDEFAPFKVKSPKRNPATFEPDFLCFLGYAKMTLEFVSKEHKDCERLDFWVEQNGKITDYIQDFHADLNRAFTELGRPDLAKLVGELVPVGKDRMPVQAADVLCWHTARAQNPGKMDQPSFRRYERLSRKNGWLETLNRDTVQQLADSFRS